MEKNKDKKWNPETDCCYCGGAVDGFGIKPSEKRYGICGQCVEIHKKEIAKFYQF